MNLLRWKTTLADFWALVAPHRFALAMALPLVVVNSLASLAVPASTQYLVDEVIGRRQFGRLLPLMLWLAGMALVQSLGSFGVQQILGRAGGRLVHDLRTNVFSHVIRLPLSFFDTAKTGVLVSRIVSDVEGARNLIGTAFLELIGSFVTAISAAVVLFNISPFLATTAVVVCVVQAGGIQARVRRMHAIYAEQRTVAGELHGRLVESLGGIRVVKSYRAEEHEHVTFVAFAIRFLRIHIKAFTTAGVIDGLGSLSFSLMALLLMWLGVREIQAGGMTVGGLLTFTAMVPLLGAPISRLTGLGGQLTIAVLAVERTRELLALPTEDQDPGRVEPVPALRGDIEFDAVSFAYGEGPIVLDGVSFHARPGTTTAIVGPSGAGKSTIAGLLTAFYPPKAGRILVDGRMLTTLRLDDYRRHLAVVLQEPFLFSGSIRDNVRFASPHAPEARFLAACHAANVDEFVQRLPDGYDTAVGERGVRLSGGQRQRICIARAILADARIVILDEATSSVDTESEALIQGALRALLAGRTTFVIAHRLSTIRRVDQILVLDRGRICEQGTHDALMARRGRYFTLHQRQDEANFGSQDRDPVCRTC